MATAARTPRPGKGPKPPFVMNDELLRHLGVPASRVRLDPPPGTATLRDVVRIRKEEGRRFELVDGTLVEKAMSVDASFVAGTLYWLLRVFVEANGRPGMVLPPDGPLRISSRYARAPDVSYTAWERLPGGKVPGEPVPSLAPDLAVEVLSPKNTRREMARKRREYLGSGVRLVWIIDPKGRTVGVYTSATEGVNLGPADTLTGGDVLPGFAATVSDLFVDLVDKPAPQPKAKKRPRRGR